MTWEHLDPNKPHLAYIILGGFTSLFMLCSLFVKEKLYIGEATVATLTGVIFGPHAANLFNPLSWGNTDQITLECSRIVLVVQCFAVGVELPKSYMERHWRSVVTLLLPVMTYGWLITSLFIWWMVEPLSWLESLACAACVTATDPVLASSVVGKGKFAKRVPKHLRDVLSAESGCNDGMAFPFIYLSIYLIRYRPDAGEVAFHWFCYTILYECIFGAVYGFLIGYIARHAIKAAEKRGLIDRESFLVFYFVLALFCAGTGSTLGVDDLLVGFSAGVGFSNDGWFTEKTEESHVSNVIDLLLNLAYFVYLGSIIPWAEYNNPDMGLTPWRLVVISLMVIFFRRIPIMMALKPVIPDVKTWREALFAGHFGPIGVGAIFAAILARAELEHETTEPLEELPGPGSKNYLVVYLIWPITTFMVISSILVHGSSIAVFTLGKRINTLTLTMSYTQGNDDGPSWMNRLPRIASTSRTSMSFRKDELESSSSEGNLADLPPGTLPPVGLPKNFLRRQKEDEGGNRTAFSKDQRRRKKKRKNMGGPVSQSAIAPVRRQESNEEEKMGEFNEKEESESPSGKSPEEPEIEVFQEGHEIVIEDEEGNVLKTEDISHETPEEVQDHIRQVQHQLAEEKSGEHAKSKHHPHEKNEGEEFEKEVAKTIEKHTGYKFHHLSKYTGWTQGLGKKHKGEKVGGEGEASGSKEKARPVKKRGPAHAYQFGNTIIVEDEDGEVVKKYTIPSAEKAPGEKKESGKMGLQRMGTWVGADKMTGKKKKGESSAAGAAAGEAAASSVTESKKKNKKDDLEEDDGIRFTLGEKYHRMGMGRRMSKQDFIKQIQQLDPKAKIEVMDQIDAPDDIKAAAQQHAQQQKLSEVTEESSTSTRVPSPNTQVDRHIEETVMASEGQQDDYTDDSGSGSDDDGESTFSGAEVPTHDVRGSLSRYSMGQAAGAQARRDRLLQRSQSADSDDDGTERIPPAELRAQARQMTQQSGGRPITQSSRQARRSDDESDGGFEGETAAERKRRLAALGSGGPDSDESDSDDNGAPRQTKAKVMFADGTKPARAKENLIQSPGPASEPSREQVRQMEMLGISGPSLSRTESMMTDRSGGGEFERGHKKKISWGGETGRGKGK